MPATPCAPGWRRRSTTTSPRRRRPPASNSTPWERATMAKPLNVGMIGYGFMGRAHSNAYRKVNHFFDLEYQPILKAVCARIEKKAKEFAEKWGYESVET